MLFGCSLLFVFAVLVKNCGKRPLSIHEYSHRIIPFVAIVFALLFIMINIHLLTDTTFNNAPQKTDVIHQLNADVISLIQRSNYSATLSSFLSCSSSRHTLFRLCFQIDEWANDKKRSKYTYTIGCSDANISSFLFREQTPLADLRRTAFDCFPPGH